MENGMREVLRPRNNYIIVKVMADQGAVRESGLAVMTYSDQEIVRAKVIWSNISSIYTNSDIVLFERCNGIDFRSADGEVYAFITEGDVMATSLMVSN